MTKTQIPLDNAPKHAEGLGRMLGHWAIIERCLSSVLGTLLGIEQSREHMLFNTFISIASKIKLIERLIHSYVIDSSEKDTLLELVKTAETFNTKRNSFVHSTWGAGSNDTLIKIDSRVPGSNKKRVRPAEVITSESIDDFVLELAVLSAKFNSFAFDGFPKLQISVKPIE